MNGRQKRHEAKIRARLAASYILNNIDALTVEDQPEWFQDMFLEELKVIAIRMKREAKQLADRNGTELPPDHLANRFKK